MLAVRNRRARRGGRSRSGAATVELAICLPILMSVALGSIEATDAIFLTEHCTSAAYEGARAATTPGQTAAGAITVANNVLTQLGITGGTVTVTPSVTATTAVGTQVSVYVSVPFSNSNSWVAPFILGRVMTTVQATVVMIHQ
jgi:Flp pilus assembly protein TadG